MTIIRRRSIRRKSGIVQEDESRPPHLSGPIEGLSEKAAKEAIQQWMDKFEISDWWNKKVEELSKGMQQKGPVHRHGGPQAQSDHPDEPFSGLDPINANLIKDEIDHLRQQGTSIIFDAPYGAGRGDL